MNREVRRVEALPEPFRLSDDAAARSSLHRRLVFLALPDDASTANLRTALAAEPALRVAPAPSRVFGGGVDVLWWMFQRPADVGLGPMLSAAELLTLLRGLVDDLLRPLAADGRVVVDWCPDANAATIAAIRSICPDALVVTDANTAASVPAPRDGVLIGDGTVQQLLAALSAPTAVRSVETSDADALRDRLVVVVGCARSGTTWLEELWLSHAGVGGVARSESWLFNQLHHVWRSFEQTPGLSSWLERAQFVEALRRFCDGVFSHALRRHSPQASYFVEKSPVHAERLPDIAAVYPDAWVVHLVRDGRDVARSISQVPFFETPDVGQAAAMWRRVLTAVRRDAPRVPRFREVTYERLHADPVGVMQELFDWVGLPRDASAEEELRATAATRVSTHAGTAGAVGPGSWRALPPRAIGDIYRSAGGLLVRAGYATRAEMWRARLRPASLPGELSRRGRTRRLR